MDCGIPLLSDVLHHVSARKGKLLRPRLVLLAAGAGGANPRSDSAVMLAAAVELIHNASLLHDDVVDMSDERRGQPSVNSLFGNKAAILSGDYLLARAMELVDRSGAAQAHHTVLSAVRSMSEGELLQLFANKNEAPSRALYLDIIGRKTASLMAASCTLGCELLGVFGYNYGMAFQINDDIADGDLFPKELTPADLLRQYCDKALAALQSVPSSPYRDAIRNMAQQLYP